MPTDAIPSWVGDDPANQMYWLLELLPNRLDPDEFETGIREYLADARTRKPSLGVYADTGSVRCVGDLTHDEFTHAELARRGNDCAPGHCYANAQRVVLAHPDYFRYGEGILATPETPYPVLHAWVELRDSNKVVEVTIPDNGPRPDPNAMYFGTTYEPDFVRAHRQPPGGDADSLALAECDHTNCSGCAPADDARLEGQSESEEGLP